MSENITASCSKEKCSSWNNGNCPMFKINWFMPVATPGKTAQPYMVEDCIPIRTMEMLTGIHLRLDGIETAIEENRNKLHLLTIKLGVLLDLIAITEGIDKKIVDKNIEHILQLECDKSIVEVNKNG
jgi:hypothetical protein